MRDCRKDFKIFQDRDIVYLDNAATTQRPEPVLEAERKFYEQDNANPFRGLYELGVKATEEYEKSRARTARFIHAERPEEIVFTRNTTESINLVSYSYASSFLKPGDEILITIAEHHSNLLPWQAAARRTGAVLKYLECDGDGSFSRESIEEAVTPRTKLAAICHISNVTGRVTPVEEIIRLVHAAGGIVLVDAAQSAPHMLLDVQEMDCDFLAFSGHKMFGPMGIGVLYGKFDLLNAMPPFLTGGEMIDSVSRDSAVWAPVPHKFEAGTVNAAGAVGLAAAMDYLDELGRYEMETHLKELTGMALEGMSRIPGLHIIGSADPGEHTGILSFTVDGVHPHDIASILDASDIDIRAGHHCAMPLLNHLGMRSCARASIAAYNSQEDIQRLVSCLETVRGLMGYGE
ncbi:MAG: SufS family cysteine desulfurase [Oscillospiraceae bacterium]|nr:SufS family cysteine desulfurase [Oscillospiraceae bacterium]